MEGKGACVCTHKSGNTKTKRGAVFLQPGKDEKRDGISRGGGVAAWCGGGPRGGVPVRPPGASKQK